MALRNWSIGETVLLCENRYLQKFEEVLRKEVTVPETEAQQVAQYAEYLEAVQELLQEKKRELMESTEEQEMVVREYIWPNQ